MIQVAIVDLRAEGRNRVVALVESWLRYNVRDAELLPRVSVKPIAIDEIAFNGEVDVCLIGPELIALDAAHISTIRKAHPKSILFAFIDNRSQGLPVIEQLGRLGIDDTLTDKTPAEEFLRKLVLLSQRKSRVREGRLLVVDSAKGGVGVTSVSAAIGEALSDNSQNICLVDWDTESQDLTRFLQARPCINEPLQYLIEHQRVATCETVKEAVVTIWEDNSNCVIVPPLPESSTSSLASSSHLRAWHAVLATLRSMYDFVIVDAGAFPYGSRKSLYQQASDIMLVIDNDVAGLYAAMRRLIMIRASAQSIVTPLIIENCVKKTGLPRGCARDHLITSLDDCTKVSPSESISFCVDASRWPASGGTMYSRSKQIRKQISNLCLYLEKGLALESIEKEITQPKLLSKLQKISQIISGKRRHSIPTVTPNLSQLNLEETLPLISKATVS